MSRASFRRKLSAVSLCKSIESAIQLFLIHDGITFVTIHNPAVYLSGARVSISPTLVPRLLSMEKYASNIPLYLENLRQTSLNVSNRSAVSKVHDHAG